MQNSRPKEAIPEHLAPRRGELVMFENSVLERLSHISPRTVLGFFVPVALLSFFQGLRVGTHLPLALVLLIAGFLFWTLFEYVFHRYVFHFFPQGEFQRKLQFTMHGVHHQYPNDKDRLVMPVAVSIPVSALLFWVSHAVLGDLGWSFFTGFVLGYLVYDMMHYSIHFFRQVRNPLFLRIRKHHMNHHFRDANRGFGVSSPFWDWIFRSCLIRPDDQ